MIKSTQNDANGLRFNSILAHSKKSPYLSERHVMNMFHQAPSQTTWLQPISPENTNFGIYLKSTRMNKVHNNQSKDMNFSAYKVMSGFFQDEYQNRYPNLCVDLNQKSRYMDCHNISSKQLTEEEKQEILERFLTEKNNIALANLKQELNGYREEKMLAQ
tara:strand:+ start:1295 stop:1774 length:480 start_codon:yes stop_codon:yes gene_type:complete